MSILVTGGAGYIGAHVVRLLVQRNKDVLVVDDLSTGRAKNVGDTTMVQLDLTSAAAPDVLAKAIDDHGVDAVIHLAARKEVGVSMERPAYYMRQNVGGMTNLLEAMEARGVSRLVFSSSAAAYGLPDGDTVDEEVRCEPINPYGETKLVGEWLCRRSADAWGLRATSLRYFNVAGAGWPDLGDPVSLNLIPMVFDRLTAGERPLVFGDDYPTPDGSCIRDYVHVLDLAESHIAALDALGTGHTVFNVGTGRGSSVFDVVDEIGRVTGLDAVPEVVDRRPGDPARLIADVGKIAAELGWRSTHALPDILSSAWEAYQRR